MSHRAGSILFFSVVGALCGFYAALTYEFFFGETEWPTPLMFWFSAWGFFFGFILAKDGFVSHKKANEEKSEDDESCLVFCGGDDVHDFLLNHAYQTPEEFNLIQERMYMIRTGRIRVPKNKSYGDAFNELMEGSDPEDIQYT